MADLRVSVVAARAAGATGGAADTSPELSRTDRGLWPVMIDVAEREPELGPAIAHVLRRTLHSEASGTVIEILMSWLRRAQHDPALLAAIERFLAGLMHDDGDREALRFVIRDARFHWTDRIRPDVAERLLDVVDTTPTRKE
jgi:hypothetical protein